MTVVCVVECRLFFEELKLRRRDLGRGRGRGLSEVLFVKLKEGEVQAECRQPSRRVGRDRQQQQPGSIQVDALRSYKLDLIEFLAINCFQITLLQKCQYENNQRGLALIGSPVPF